MKNRKKRTQREEVRKILRAMREDLAQQRIAYEHETSRPVMHLDEFIARASAQVRGSA